MRRVTGIDPPADRSRLPRFPKRVADAPDGVDEGRSVGVDLVAQVGDVGLEHAGVAGKGVVPHVLEDLVTREHAPGVGQQVVEELVLRWGELDEPAVAPHLARVLVELEVGEGQLVLAGTGAAGPPSKPLYPRPMATSSVMWSSSSTTSTRGSRDAAIPAATLGTSAVSMAATVGRRAWRSLSLSWEVPPRLPPALRLRG